MAIMNFLKSEDGTITEYLVRILIISLGGASILFGILIACRQKGGEIINAINTVGF